MCQAEEFTLARDFFQNLESVINGIAKNSQWGKTYPSQGIKYEVKELIKKKLLWMLAYIGLSF